MAHKTPSGTTSGAWRELEKKVADLFRKNGFRRAKRIVRNDDYGAERPDVDVPEIPSMAVDTKYKNGGFSHHTLFLDEVDKYVGVKRLGEDKEYDFSIMPTRSGGSKDIFVTLRLEALLKILAKAFLRNSDGGWSCPQCPDHLEQTGDMLGLTRYTCAGCSLSILTQDKMGEVLEEPDKKRDHKTLILDNSKNEEFKPLPGQLTLKDLVERKKRQRKPKDGGKL